MKCKTILLTLFGLLGWAAVNAQTLPRKVSNIELLNLEGKPARLPYWGRKEPDDLLRRSRPA